MSCITVLMRPSTTTTSAIQDNWLASMEQTVANCPTVCLGGWHSLESYRAHPLEREPTYYSTYLGILQSGVEVAQQSASSATRKGYHWYLPVVNTPRQRERALKLLNNRKDLTLWMPWIYSMDNAFAGVYHHRRVLQQHRWIGSLSFSLCKCHLDALFQQKVPTFNCAAFQALESKVPFQSSLAQCVPRNAAAHVRLLQRTLRNREVHSAANWQWCAFWNRENSILEISNRISMLQESSRVSD